MVTLWLRWCSVVLLDSFPSSKPTSSKWYYSDPTGFQTNKIYRAGVVTVEKRKGFYKATFLKWHGILDDWIYYPYFFIIIQIYSWYPKHLRFKMDMSVGFKNKSLLQKWLFHHFHPFKTGCLDATKTLEFQQPMISCVHRSLTTIRMNCMYPPRKRTND